MDVRYGVSATRKLTKTALILPAPKYRAGNAAQWYHSQNHQKTKHRTKQQQPPPHKNSKLRLCCVYADPCGKSEACYPAICPHGATHSQPNHSLPHTCVAARPHEQRSPPSTCPTGAAVPACQAAGVAQPGFAPSPSCPAAHHFCHSCTPLLQTDPAAFRRGASAGSTQRRTAATLGLSVVESRITPSSCHHGWDRYRDEKQHPSTASRVVVWAQLLPHILAA